MSFYLSLARAGVGALAVLGVVILVAVVAVNSRGNDAGPRALDTSSPSAQPSTTVEPTRSERPSSPDPAASPTLRPARKVTVRVLNGNGTTGIAGRTSDDVEAAGYKVLEPGNAEITPNTTIYFRKDAEADAEALRRALFDYVDPANVVKATGDLPSGLIVVVLGEDHSS